MMRSTDTQAAADLTERARLLRRQCQSAMTSEEADRMFASALQSEREAAAAEARRAVIEECARRVLRTGWPNCEDAAGIIRDLASPPAPQEETR